MLIFWRIVGFAAVLLLFDTLFSWLSTCDPTNYPSPTNQSYEEYCSAFRGPIVSITSFATLRLAEVFDEHGEAVIAAFTVVLAISTIMLWGSTRDAARAGARAAIVAEHSLTKLERAFVSYGFHIHGAFDPTVNRVIRWEITPRWTNDGATHTRHLHTHASWEDFPGRLPPDFNFPDRWNSGVDHINELAFIGPKGTIMGEALIVDASILDAARMGWIRVYIWGWAEYDDVFENTAAHRTEFCNEIVVLIDPYTIPGPNNPPFQLRIQDRHTGADDDCYHRPRPAAERYAPIT